MMSRTMCFHSVHLSREEIERLGTYNTEDNPVFCPACHTLLWMGADGRLHQRIAHRVEDWR